MHKYLRNFKDDNCHFLLDECYKTIRMYTGKYLTYADLSSKCFKDNNVAHLKLELYMNGATTDEQDKLLEFVKHNKYPNLDVLYPSKFGKVYKIWGRVTYPTDHPFIIININDYQDQILVTENFVKKYFSDDASVKPTKGQL